MALNGVAVFPLLGTTLLVSENCWAPHSRWWTLGGMIIKHHLLQSRSSNSAASNALSDVSDVRFGSKADICAAKRRVRFTPNSDRESGHFHLFREMRTAASG